MIEKEKEKLQPITTSPPSITTLEENGGTIMTEEDKVPMLSVLTITTLPKLVCEFWAAVVCWLV